MPAVLLEQRTSSLGEVVSVVQTDDHRVLLSERAVIGMEFTNPVFRFQAVFGAMALMQVVTFLSPTPTRALCLGLGAGTVPHFLRASAVHTDVIELDDEVISFAEKHFLFGDDSRNYPAGGRAIHGDAIEHMWTEPLPGSAPYDLVLSDLWSGGNHGRALRLDFFRRIRSTWLAPNGVLAINLVAFASGPHAVLATRVARTLRAAFAHVRCFAEYDVHHVATGAPSGANAEEGAWRHCPHPRRRSPTANTTGRPPRGASSP